MKTLAFPSVHIKEYFERGGGWREVKYFQVELVNIFKASIYNILLSFIALKILNQITNWLNTGLRLSIPSA